MKKLIILSLLLMGVQSLSAQTLEPKLYSNLPIGLNFLLLGYGHSQGSIPENASLGLENPNLNINSTFLVYGRTFNILGHNTKNKGDRLD